MPSHRPVRAARRSECSGLGNAPSRSGPRRSASGGDGSRAPSSRSRPLRHTIPSAVGDRRDHARGAAVRRALPGDGEGVGEVVDVGELGELQHGQPRRLQRRPRADGGVLAGHRHVGQHRGRLRAVQAERPPAAVRRRSQDRDAGTGGLEQLHALGQQAGCHLRGVHADEQRRRRAVGHGVGERRGQPRAQVAVDLRHHHEPVELEVAGGAVEGHDPVDGPRRPHRVEGVAHRGRGDPGGLSGVHGGVSRVLLRPGTGALVITSTWVRLIAPAPRACRGRCGRCPAPCR